MFHSHVSFVSSFFHIMKLLTNIISHTFPIKIFVVVPYMGKQSLHYLVLGLVVNCILVVFYLIFALL